MSEEEFIQKYEELLNNGYCECNELNCLDNNPPRKILSIMKGQKEEIERLHSIIKEVREWIRIVQNNEDGKHLEPIINTDELDYILEILNKESDKE